MPPVTTAVGALAHPDPESTSFHCAGLSFQTLVEQSQDLITVLDSDGRITYDNPAVERILGYASGELVGRNAFELVHPADFSKAFSLLVQVVARPGTRAGMTLRYRHKHGVWRWLEAAGTSLSGGSRPRVVVTSRDVTEKVREAEGLHLERGELAESLRRQRWELDSAHSEMLTRLARAAECRDDDTGEHTRRVGTLAARLAAVVVSDCRQVELIRRAAPLHDVGKIGIPDGILRKPGPLEDGERRVMETHTLLGASILAGGESELVRTAESIALNHHERWDGSGYPAGLRGEEIPLPARIVAVADFYDAMTHDRPYRAARPHHLVTGLIRGMAGSAFEPGLVREFLRLTQEEQDQRLGS